METRPAASPPHATPRDGFTSAGGRPAVPIVLGVVGHRDVRDGDLHKERLKGLIREFQAAYANTPVIVLSALAEGADQVAARAALEVGAFVRAPLPMEPDAYRLSTSFSGDKGREELDRLLNDPRVEAFVVPLPPGTVPDGTDWTRVATDAEDPQHRRLRHTCYANAGGYIVRRCHALIALWDGDEAQAGKPSGTAEHVAFKLRGEAPSLYPWTKAEPLGFRGDRGLVMALHVTRAGTPAEEASRPPGELRVLVPSQEDEPWTVPAKRLPLPRYLGRGSRFAARLARSLGVVVRPEEHGKADAKAWIAAELRQLRETCTTIEDFNRGIEEPALAADIDRRMRDDARLRAQAFDERHNQWLVRLTRVREAAAAVSGRLQKRLGIVRPAVFVLVGLSILALHLYAHAFEYDRARGHTLHRPAFLAAFLLLLLLAAVVVAWDWWTSLDQRRLDSRALAEALRVRRAWAMAGIGRSVADTYLGQIRSELSWIRLAVQHVCPPPAVWAEYFAGIEPERRRALLETVRAEWVGRHELEHPRGQLAQYRKGHRRQHRLATFYRLTGLALALGGWVALGVQLFQDAHHPSHRDLIVASSVVIAGGLLIAFCERESHEELAKQYERAALVFENGSREMAARLEENDIEGAQRVVEALGHEAVMEHSQWLILRRSRPLELHIG